MAIVSVIIPVYNVENFLDNCLNSIVNQSFKDIEILLLNDGSTDNSEMKCLNWTKRDNRIKYYFHINQGLGPTRNRGIEIAQGKYIMFVDADDWIDYEYVKSMYEMAIAYNSDLVICDFYSVYEDEIKYSNANVGIGKNIHQKLMKITSNSVWKTLSEKELWVKNNLKMHAFPYEDLSVFPILIISSRLVTNVEKPLYYYRCNRKNSIMNKANNQIYLINAVKELRANAIRLNIYKEYKNEIMYLIFENVRYLLSQAKVDMNEKDFAYLIDRYNEFFCEYKDWNIWWKLLNCKICIIGSYNMTCVLKYIQNPINMVNFRYSFTGIISLTADKLLEAPITHSNRFRSNMIKMDMQKNLWENLIEETPEYVFIDFLDERFDIAQDGEKFFTISDAFIETKTLILNYNVLNKSLEEVYQLWETRANIFFDKLNKSVPFNKIVILKNFLAKTFGNEFEQNKYENIEEICEINKMLEKYYNYIRIKFPDIIQVDVNNELLYTDNNFPYGKYEWHFNEQLYKRSAINIINALMGGN